MRAWPEAGSGRTSSPVATRIDPPVMRLRAVFVTVLVSSAVASGCGSDRSVPVGEIETGLRSTLDADLDRALTIGCVAVEPGAYACSVHSGPVGVPGSEDDAYRFAGLVDVICDRGRCGWQLSSEDDARRTRTGTFSVG